MALASPPASVVNVRVTPSAQLHQAAVQGNAALILQLLSQNPGYVDGPSDSGAQAPLLAAALLGQQNVVEVLLNAGGNPNRRGKRQETPLMLAAQRGHVDVMRVLLGRGAQATTVDQRGWTALHFGAFSGQAAAIRAIISATASSSRASLLELRSSKGETALALAAFGRKDDCCRALIQAGAKPALINDPGDREYVLKLQPASAANGGGDAVAPATPKGLSTISPRVSRGGSRGGAATAAPPPAVAARQGGSRTPLVTEGLGSSQALESPGMSPSARPTMQFSGTPSEFERCALALY